MNPFSLPYDCLSDYEWLGQQSLAPVKLSRIIQNVDDFFALADSSYSESQDHSQVIDDLFGFRIEAVEQKIAAAYNDRNSDWEGCEVWHKLNPRQLQTPYDEILSILKDAQFAGDQTLVDLGAGYGRAGVIIGELFPAGQFLGLEIVAARAREGNRIFSLFGHDNSRIEVQGVHECDFELPQAQVYFLYDFGRPSQIEIILNKLASDAFKRPFHIVARGRGVRSLIDYKFPQFHRAFSPLHTSTYSVYSTYCDLGAGD